MLGGCRVLKRLVIVWTCVTTVCLIESAVTATRVEQVPPTGASFRSHPRDAMAMPYKYSGCNSSRTATHLLKELQDLEAKQRGLGGGCSCSSGRYDVLPQQTSDAYERWQQREQFLSPRPPLALCPADSTLQLASSGLEIEPMQSVKLVGLAASSSASLRSSRDSNHRHCLKIVSAHDLGLLLVTSKVNINVEGNNTREMTLLVTGESDGELNTALKSVIYQSTVNVIDRWETIRVNFLEYELNIHIRVRRKRLPYLYQTSSMSPPIHEIVTLVVKTFEQYDRLNRLIDSVSKFYPHMTVIVADDSVYFQTVDKKNVMQYKMPPQAGWLAGRNLLVSQVRTEYFVWVNDDYIFTDATNLELLMEKLDRLELKLDLVSGYIGDHRECGGCVQVQRGKDGPCVIIDKTCDHGALEGYPQCIRVDHASSFFMARTRSVQEIGFDVRLNDIDSRAYTEFFMDGYMLSAACCSDVSVNYALEGGVTKHKVGGQKLVRCL